jgi:gamma-glutamyltranspeptidase
MVIHFRRREIPSSTSAKPLAARADMYLDARGNPVSDKSVNGYLQGVPGTGHGTRNGTAKYGTPPRSLMAPSIRLRGTDCLTGAMSTCSTPRPQFRRSRTSPPYSQPGAPFKAANACRRIWRQPARRQ